MTRDVKGLDELLRVYRRLPEEIRGDPMVASLRSAANIIRDDAKRRVPVDSGLLQRKITTSKMRERDLARSYAGVSVRVAPGAEHWNTIEFGKSIKHNAPPQPFLRPAFEENKGQALERFRSDFGKRLDRIVEDAKK